MAGEVPVLGQPQQTNNPLVILNAHLGEITLGAQPHRQSAAA